MAWRLNKGDWSEAYVFLKLLAEGKIYSGNENLEKIENVFMDVFKVIRKNGGKYTEYTKEIDYIIAYEEGEEFIQLSAAEFADAAERLFLEIKGARGSKAFEFHDTEHFLRSLLRITNIKEKCVEDEKDNKTDILLEVQNSNDCSRETVGFSIKSHLGSPATLFNYSAASKMVYRIDGCDEATMHYLNSLKNSRQGCDLDARMAYIKGNVALNLVFLGSKIIDNRRYGDKKETGPFFTWNLEHYDTDMLLVFNAMLLSDYGFYPTPKSRGLKDIVETMAEMNPLDVHSPSTVYKTKFKDFLFMAFAGLTASKKWDGSRRINGGYIDVKKNGEILYCRAISDERFTNYLFKNMKLERPQHGSYCKYTIYQAEKYLNGKEIPDSVWRERNEDKRGDYGYVYLDEEHYEKPCYCIDINFSFRFKK